MAMPVPRPGDVPSGRRGHALRVILGARALRRSRRDKLHSVESSPATTASPPPPGGEVDLYALAQSLSCLTEGMRVLLGTLRERWSAFDESQRLNLLGLVDQHVANLSVLLGQAMTAMPPGTDLELGDSEGWDTARSTISLP